jgi:hypothetical protein
LRPLFGGATAAGSEQTLRRQASNSPLPGEGEDVEVERVRVEPSV